MSAVAPLVVSPTPDANLASAYWRCLCMAAAYVDNPLPPLVALTAPFGGLGVVQLNFPSFLPNRVFVLRFAGGAIVITIGTTNPGQFVSQAVGAIFQANPHGPGQVNSYDLISANVIAPAVALALTPINPATVIYQGHSLGGAVSQLLAQYPSVWPVGGVFSAGQPRVGDSIWAEAYNLVTERWTTTGDPVPCVPPSANSLIDRTLQVAWPFAPHSYRHAGRRFHVTTDGEISEPEEVPSWIEGTDYLVNVVLGATGWYGAHASANYAARVRQAIPVPWLTGDPAWPMLTLLDTLAIPLLGDQAGVPSTGQFTTNMADQTPVGIWAEEGIC